MQQQHQQQLRVYGLADGGSVGSPAGPNYRRTTTSFLVSADWRYQRMYVDTMFFPEAPRTTAAEPRVGELGAEGTARLTRETPPQQDEEGLCQEQQQSGGDGHGGPDIFACRPYHTGN